MAVRESRAGPFRALEFQDDGGGVEIKLVVIEGKAKGREIPLPATQFIIGRESRCHLRPHSEQVSKVHCAIAPMPGNRVIVRDLNSRNKTFVNDEPIKGTVRVFDGDVLTVGPLKFRFAIKTETPSQPVHENDVLWLMDRSTDAFDVESSSETGIIEIPPELLAENLGQAADPDAESVGVGLSAGKHLREHVRRTSQSPPRPTTVRLKDRQAEFVDKLVAQLNAAGSPTPPTPDEVVESLIDGVEELDIDLADIKSLDQIKAKITDTNHESI